MPETVLPAEWAPQSGVMLTWPHPQSDWRPYLPEAQQTFLALAQAIAAHQDLLIGCFDRGHLEEVRDLLVADRAPMERIHLYSVPSNDTWARDHGPITVLRDGKPVLLDFRFNGWGEKFDAALDDFISRRLHQAGAFGATPLEEIDFILEGGSIESDGLGTLLTTSACLLSETRNSLGRKDIEIRLGELLGVKRFLWLENGHMAGDDTDSHIDTLARLCDPETIAYQACDDPYDEHYQPLAAMAEELRTFTTPTGNPYRLVPLPLPAPIYDEEGRRLPAGYANFLILNEAVLVPTYRDSMDDIAIQRLRTCFPGREVVGVPCSTLIQQNGSLHCVTMQLPAGVLAGSGN